MSGAYRVACPGLAVDVLPFVPIHRVVPDRSRGHREAVIEDEPHQGAPERSRTTAPGEHPLVIGAVPRSQVSRVRSRFAMVRRPWSGPRPTQQRRDALMVGP